ncbi:D-2-hydroxyacid dehydrogenase [Caldinitratiruptor microaerophilus]|uniref:2-ketoacid reductase n=1 Tax=Caldinitratiruptor microaerophilus TaxID=671077 RepID=A0AA35CP17_9FIRM|nr:D-2-hydroxyacid dehydrogenase [Caldinitratiruptor microaerophilus]BDG60926.1 2-ketoacid reductase [Caldinitratiruptor microaerophilus]
MAETLLVYHRTEADEIVRLLREGGYPGPILRATAPEEATALSPEAEILLAGRFPAEAMERARRLRWIQSLWAGVEQWMSLPIPDGVVLTRMVGPFGPLIAQYVFAHLLAHAYHIDLFRQQQARREWKQHRPERLMGRVLGVAGLGAIGTEIARLGQALGMRIRGLNRSGAPHPLAERVFPVRDVREFVREVDYLVLVLPNTPETYHLFDRSVLENLKPGAVLVNVGRGATVDEAALADVIRSGRIRLAVLDVFETEPLPPESPLWDLPGVVITPHCSGPTVPADAVPVFLENYRRWVSGEPLLGVVDRQRGY